MACFPTNKLLSQYAPLRPVSTCKGLLAHQSRDTIALWNAWEIECGHECAIPFWADVWPGARFLSEYVLANPHLVAGKRVFEFGCGGALCGISALSAGAQKVFANDIDPVALFIAMKNADANGVCLDRIAKNVLQEPFSEDYDVIFVAEMFYQLSQAKETLEFCKQKKKDGVRVIIADGERPFAPQTQCKLLKEKRIPVNVELEGVETRLVRLLEIL